MATTRHELLSNATAAQLKAAVNTLEITGIDRRSPEAMRLAISRRPDVDLPRLKRLFEGVVAGAKAPLAAPARDVFAAIDFETADNGRDSACAVGVVRVEDGVVVDKRALLIRPPRRTFLFTGIHGIRWSDVADQPTFDGVWPQLAPLIAGASQLYAHNASFDHSVMDACCRLYRMPPPAQAWGCTLRLARATWKRPQNKLSDVCAFLGIALVHHEALSDAEGCARIVLAARQATAKAQAR